MSILEGELAAAVAGMLLDAEVPYEVTITRTTTTPADPYDPDSTGTTTVTDHVGRGWTEQYSDESRDGTLIDQDDVRVMVLTTTIDIEPTDDGTDKLAVHGQTFTIMSVQRDASGTFFVIQGRA